MPVVLPTDSSRRLGHGDLNFITRDLLEREAAAGTYMKDLAIRYGCSYSSIRKRAKKYGIKFKKQNSGIQVDSKKTRTCQSSGCNAAARRMGLCIECYEQARKQQAVEIAPVEKVMTNWLTRPAI